MTCFFWFMEAHCNDRTFPLNLDCRVTRDIAYNAVSLPGVVSSPNPGTVEIRNAATGKCADVEGPSLVDGTPIQQWSCVGVLNQRFQIWPAPGAPGYFHIMSVYSGKCVRAWYATSTVFQNTCYSSWLSERMYLQGALNADQYSIREQYTGSNNCWSVPGFSYSSGTDLAHPVCDDYSYWFIWRIVNV